MLYVRVTKPTGESGIAPASGYKSFKDLMEKRGEWFKRHGWKIEPTAVARKAGGKA